MRYFVGSVAVAILGAGILVLLAVMIICSFRGRP